jgi:hypothetical protein
VLEQPLPPAEALQLQWVGSSLREQPVRDRSVTAPEILDGRPEPDSLVRLAGILHGELVRDRLTQVGPTTFADLTSGFAEYRLWSDEANTS